MSKKGWVDPQGRKGKVRSSLVARSRILLSLIARISSQGYGVYRFQDKYGANVDGYSPIYTPDQWADTGDSYKLGTKGLIAWAGLLLVLLGVGINLVVSTSAIGQ